MCVPRTPHIVFSTRPLGYWQSYLPRTADPMPTPRRGRRGLAAVTGRNVAVGARTRAREGTSRGASWESNAPRRRPRAVRLVRRDVHTGVLRARRGDVRDARVGARRARGDASPLVELRVRHAGDRATRRARAHAAAARVPARRSRRDSSAPRDAARRADGARRRAVGSFSFRIRRRARGPARAVAHARAVRLGAGGRRRFGGSGTSKRDRVRAHSTARRARAQPQTRRLGEGRRVRRRRRRKRRTSFRRRERRRERRERRERYRLATRRAKKSV